MKTIILSEHEEQKNLIKWCKLNKNKYQNLDLIFAIPNGNVLSYLNRNIAMRSMNKMKLEGLTKGIPDLFLPVAKGEFHGLFIEMKRIKNSTTSKEQKEKIEALNNQGYKAVICKGFEGAKKVILEYYGGING